MHEDETEVKARTAASVVRGFGSCSCRSRGSGSIVANVSQYSVLACSFRSFRKVQNICTPYVRRTPSVRGVDLMTAVLFGEERLVQIERRRQGVTFHLD